jgi:hypothetical protein
MKRRLVGLLAMVMLCSSVLLAQGPAPDKNPILGTWKQNLQKSTYNPGPPPPALAYSVRQYSEADDGSIIAITMNVSPDGIPSLGSISPAKYDGKEYQQHNLTTLSHIAKQTNRTISYKPIDHLTVEIVQKQDGEVVSKSTRTISTDGRTMTERFAIAAGQPVNNVLVFERQ